MARYASPDRPRALWILEKSAEQQAARAGVPVSELVAREVGVCLNIIDERLAHPDTIDVASYSAARDRLVADPNYLYEYRQDQVEASFTQELGKLGAGLSRSRVARALIDTEKLETLLGDRLPGSGEVTADQVVAALHRVQVVAPLTGGIEAYATVNAAAPLVGIGYGVSSLVLRASHLIVAYGMRETSPGVSNPRSLRDDPEEYSRAVEELESLIRWSELGSHESRASTVAPPHYHGIVFPVAAHALSFFVFHELGHLLVAGETPYEEELACDEFAASILGTSDDDRCWLGVGMAAQLLTIVLRRSHTEWRSAEYPGASYRFSNILSAMQRAGARIQPPVDYLLDIPTRVYEQEVFETDTRRLVFFSYAAALLARWNERVETSSALQMALAVLDYAVRLPSVVEHPQLTNWQDESGQRAYVLDLEPYRALQVAGWMLSVTSPQWEHLAAEAALLLITTVNHDPPPTNEAASLFLALARHKPGAAKRDRASLDYLGRIGAIDDEPTLFPRSTGTTVFYHGQAPGDGDIPVSGNPVARKQLSAIMEAWHAYSNRTDRERPWHVQRGTKVLDGWPS